MNVSYLPFFFRVLNQPMPQYQVRNFSSSNMHINSGSSAQRYREIEHEMKKFLLDQWYYFPIDDNS